MKQIYLLLLAACIFSCQNNTFLDRFPKDSFSEPTYFKTENDLMFYANQFYESLPVQFMNQDNNSDNMVPRSIDAFLAGTYSIPSTGGGWNADNWGNIRKCNYFLTRYSKAETPQKEIYAGEVCFFRALFYWQKVVQFGDVPLVLKDMDDSSEEMYGPRVNHKLVMDQVLKDLDYAVDNLPDKGQAKAGRLNKDAAHALKSRICLWEGTFRKYHQLGDEDVFLKACVQASEELMGGRYSIYSTGKPQEDYRNLFIQLDLTGNSEAIFYRKYIKDLNTHNYTRESGENNTGLSKDFVDSYLFVDAKPIGISSYLYDDTTPANECKDRDLRYKQTVATPGFIWKDDSKNPLQVTLPEIGTSRTSSGYWIIKGRSSDVVQTEALKSDIDAFIFRYAEVLLNYAEAKYELTGTLTSTELDNSINKIRARVNMPPLTATPTADPHPVDYGYTVSPLLYEIRRERRIELVGEGLRFNDILRWKAGKLIENKKTILGMKLTDDLRNQYLNPSALSTIKTDESQCIIVYPALTNGRIWNDKMYLYPLPTEQIKLCNYEQNPGWK